MTMVFEAYTYFGRIISRHPVKEGETHHRAAAAAIDAAFKWEADRARKPAWVRVVETPYVEAP